MATVLYGGGIIDQRGSISGNTYSRSKFGATVRAKTSPVNPQTAHNTLARATLVNQSRSWSQLLTEGERAQWNAFALISPLTNVFGQVSYLSGQQWWTKLASQLTAANTAVPTTPPVSSSYLAPTGLNLTATSAGAGTLNITFTDPGWTGTPAINVYASPNLSPGVYYVNSQLRQIEKLNAIPGTYNIIADWKLRFNQVPLLSGRKIVLLVTAIDLDSGVVSAGTFISAIIT